MIVHHPHPWQARGGQCAERREIGQIVHVGQVGLETLQRGVDRKRAFFRHQRKTIAKRCLPDRFGSARAGSMKYSHVVPASLQFRGGRQHVGFSSGRGPKTFMHKQHSHVRCPIVRTNKLLPQPAAIFPVGFLTRAEIFAASNCRQLGTEHLGSVSGCNPETGMGKYPTGQEVLRPLLLGTHRNADISRMPPTWPRPSWRI